MTSYIIEFFALAFLLFISAYFSSTEMAYITANKIKLELKSKRKNYIFNSLKYFIKKPEDFFATILLGNNLINTAFASISAIFFTRLFNLTEFEILIFSTILLLIFGEIIPKYLVTEISERYITYSVLILKPLSIILSPFVKILSRISNKIINVKNTQQENLTLLYDKDDIMSLIEESHQAGEVKKQERNIIQRALDLSEQKIYECMRPRTDIVGIEINSNINDLKSLFLDSGYSKLIVFEENLDNIKGFVLLKDMFKNPSEISEILRDIKYFPETKKSIEVLNDLIENKISIGVVVDEFGGTAGIVTVEDILEELFGEIKDEFDEEEVICRRISKGNFLVSGKVEVDHFNEKYDLDLPSGDYETIAGFIEFHSGRIPKVGETIKIDKFNFIIVKATQTKIELVKIIVLNE